MSQYSSSHMPTPLVVAMVGLPAKGKSYISQKLTRYFNWYGLPTQIFNAGEYRRADESSSKDDNNNQSSFYSAQNADAKAQRDRWAAQALNHLCEWLKDGKGMVAIFDATNTDLRRRQMVSHVVEQEYCLDLLFLESVCNDQERINKTIVEGKANGPDYKGRMDVKKATDDFLGRIEGYAQVYKELDETEGFSFIKIVNAGEQILSHKIFGSIQERILNFLSCTHLENRSIYLSSPSTMRSFELPLFIQLEKLPNLEIWCSKECAALVKSCETRKLAQLKNSLFDDLTEQIDLVIHEIELNKNNLLIIAQKPILDCLLSYFGKDLVQYNTHDSIVKLFQVSNKYDIEELSFGA